MNERPLNVLFLCTGNSARSILAEQLMNHRGGGRFRGFSAGSHPNGKVHPAAVELLGQMNLSTDGLRSKSWDEFARPDAPKLDFIVTVCDNAAGESCPIWPGHPATAHWGIDDPAAVDGSETEQRLAFRQAYEELERRISSFVSLPVHSLDRETLQRRIRAIGTTIGIREVTAVDAEAIAVIYNHYIHETVVTFEEEPISASDMAGRIAEVAAASLPWLVAERAGEVVGYARATKWKPRSAYRHSVETTIYLSPQHLGAGVGTALYQALLGELKERRLHLAIGGVALPNAASVALHEKLGFRKVAHFNEVGFKFGRWIDVAYWQLSL